MCRALKEKREKQSSISAKSQLPSWNPSEGSVRISLQSFYVKVNSNNMKKITVFIDESGTLPDPKDRVVVVAAVGASFPERIKHIIKAVRKRGKFEKEVGEVKFYTSGDKSRTLFLEKVVEEDFDIFVLTVEKMGRKIPDTPKHFALLCWLLLTDVFNFYPSVKQVIFDKHFHREKDIEEFNKNLKGLVGEKLPPVKHVNSKEDKKVNVADMVAGAVLAKETGKGDRFYKIFRDQIISETRINWPEAKRKLFPR